MYWVAKLLDFLDLFYLFDLLSCRVAELLSCQVVHGDYKSYDVVFCIRVFVPIAIEFIVRIVGRSDCSNCLNCASLVSFESSGHKTIRYSSHLFPLTI